MLTRFEAYNFKSIKEATLEMRPFMVLVGPNGAGKTNIVRALELFGEVLRRGTTDPVREQGYDQLIRREKRPARSGLKFVLRLELPRSVIEMSNRFSFPLPTMRNRPRIPPDLRPVILDVSVTFTGSVNSEEVRVAEETLTFHSGLDHLSIKLSEGGVEESLGENEILKSLVHRLRLPEQQEEDSERLALILLNWQRHSSPWMRYLRDSAAVTRLRLDASALRRDSSFEESSRDQIIGPNGEGLAAAVNKLRGSGNKPLPRFQSVLEALQGVYPRIEDVRAQRIQPGRLVLLIKERGISEELGQSNVSDGVLHALALLVALEGGLGGPGLLAIEEPENAIHPWSLRSMVERAQKYATRQILLTTHSETVVNAVEDPSSLYIVENDDKLGTTITPAIQREVALDTILRETEQRLGDVWLDGSLGGVPRSQP